jgi:hypothetical protein
MKRTKPVLLKRVRVKLFCLSSARRIRVKVSVNSCGVVFKSQCKEAGVSSIIVEANKLGASGFYELLGFRYLGNFNSPLHEFATKRGQACLYEYVFE